MTKEAYEAGQALIAIYDSRLSKGQSKRKLRGWMRRVTNCKLTYFDRFLGTLKSRFEEITNYFVGRRTSGFVDWLNNQLKVITRRCYGMTSLKHLYQKYDFGDTDEEHPEDRSIPRGCLGRLIPQMSSGRTGSPSHWSGR